MLWCLIVFYSGVVLLVSGNIIPEPKFEVSSPAGLRISIPDNGFSNISMMTFINWTEVRCKANQMSKNITKEGMVHWVFEDTNIKLSFKHVMRVAYHLYVTKHGTKYSRHGHFTKEWSPKEYDEVTTLQRLEPLMPEGYIRVRCLKYIQLTETTTSKTIPLSNSTTLNNANSVLIITFGALSYLNAIKVKF